MLAVQKFMERCNMQEVFIKMDDKMNDKMNVSSHLLISCIRILNYALIPTSFILLDVSLSHEWHVRKCHSNQLNDDIPLNSPLSVQSHILTTIKHM
jgi:hypothetical protein